MHYHDRGATPYFTFDAWGDDGRLQHAVFTRYGGVSAAPFNSLNLSVSVPDDKDDVYANRRRAYGLFGRDTDSVVHAHLVHGAAVARATRADDGTWLHPVDGLVTDEPGCALTMNYADCAPVLLYDPDHGAVGLGHAGWQGAVKDLPGALVQAMTRHFGSEPARLQAALGPTIGACCYEVGEPVISAVHGAFDAAERLLVNQGPGRRPHFDLPAANRAALKRAGVGAVEAAPFCTACRTDLFFSHRAEKGRTGRHGIVVMLSASQEFPDSRD